MKRFGLNSLKLLKLKMFRKIDYSDLTKFKIPKKGRITPFLGIVVYIKNKLYYN